jgi:hypothetical protein
LLPSHNTLQGYDSLANGYRVIFAHEFFHTVQWNVLLNAGCPTRQWTNVFLEAQAKVASSVQYPELELSKAHLIAGSSEYGNAAQRFLALRLEASYADLEAEQSELYDAALYWRFLYDQFGDMRIIRVALEEMACRPVADIPASLSEVMDAALARLDGPIETFEESMVAFARANYALRLEDGRRTTANPSTHGQRYYDPHSMYPAPSPEAELHYSGPALTYDGSVPASYGSDLIEIALAPGMQGQPMTVAFRSEGARFSVQAWKLRDGGKQNARALTPHPETMTGDCSIACRYAIPRLNAAQYDRLALIVVRLDAHEKADSRGAYRLIVGAAH